MPEADGDSEIERACPYLGLPDDARTHFAFATPAHRCHAKRRPAAIDLSHQGSYCLTPDYPACNRFPADARATGPTAARPTLDPAGDGRLLRRTPVIDVAPRIVPTVPTTAVVSARPTPRPAPRPAAPGPPGPPTTARKRGFLAQTLVLVLLVVTAVVVVLASGVTGPRPAATGSTSVTSAPGRAVPSAIGGETASPTAPSTSAAPSTRPAIASPMAAATAATAGRRTHVVRSGDTLISIAERYDVTPQAIRRTNRISDPNFLRIGQRLVIPSP